MGLRWGRRLGIRESASSDYQDKQALIYQEAISRTKQWDIAGGERRNKSLDGSGSGLTLPRLEFARGGQFRPDVLLLRPGRRCSAAARDILTGVAHAAPGHDKVPDCSGAEITSGSAEG
jgi:hypothetical protein